VENQAENLDFPPRGPVETPLLKINLGCGRKKIEGYVNLDSNPHVEPDVLINVGRDPWPFEDSSVDRAAASHIMEHLDTDELMHFMKELYRVMKPGHPIHVAVPHPRHDVFINDPTHKTPITLTTLGQFSNAFHREMKWVHTPHSSFLKVDFTLIEINALLDKRFEGKELSHQELSEIEQRENNVIIEYHIIMAAEKPYSEE
jgi:SAM-dependent methyltransferase